MDWREILRSKGWRDRDEAPAKYGLLTTPVLQW
ncbi:hypothetical protein J2805_000066 [Arthrobacter oryzae]|jgi:hypothetical protein|nr:hypothetical protein [Arthrobacter oryzae]